MALSDEQIGSNLTTLRGDMSQKEFAARMRERGWKWSQATVWSVEKGERALRFAEALDATDILDSELTALVGDADDLEALFFDSKYRRALDDVRDELRKAIDWHLEVAELMDSRGVPLTPRMEVLASDTVWQAFTRTYTNLAAEHFAELDDPELGAYRRAVISAWKRDRDRLREEWYGKHQEEA